MYSFYVIRWIQSFLNDYRARVQLSNAFSSSRRYTLGLRQGFFFALLLFLFYINILASSLNDDALMLSLLMTSQSSLQPARKQMLKPLFSQKLTLCWTGVRNGN